MSSRFTCSLMKQKKIRYILQIGNYSNYVAKGYYTSPEFGDDEYESKWSLLVYVYADHENFIDVRLKINDSVIEDQLLNVKISIINCFGFNMFKNERTFLLRDWNEYRILAVTEEQLKGYFGLKKFFYLPIDTLTLQCDLVINENHVSAYNNVLNFLHDVPRDNDSFLEYFTHSRLGKMESDYFVWKICNFSIHTYRGYTIGPEYESKCLGGKWTLVVCSATDNCLAESLDVILMRRESNEHQLIKTKLLVVDNDGEVMLCREKNVYFMGSGEFQLLSFSQKDISGWFGYNKNEQNDTLILRCEMSLCEQIDDNFSSKDDFEKSIVTNGYAPKQLIPFLPFICVILFGMLYMFYYLCFVLLSYILYPMLDILKNVSMFLISVIVLMTLLFYIKYEAEKLERRSRRFRRSYRQERR